MIITAGVLVWCLFATSTSQTPEQRPQPARELTSEEVQIIVAALSDTGLREARRFAQGARRDAAVAVVSDSTLAACRASGPMSCIRESAYSTIVRLLGGVGSPLAAAFTAQTAASSTVQSFAERIELISPSELDVIFSTGRGWEEFHERFGRAGLVRFSAPAIAGDQAAVYVVFGCGGLCGKSWLVTLERRRGEFRIKKARILTVS